METIISIVSLTFSIATVIAAVVVYRGTYGRAVAETQSHVIEAQSEKLTLMKADIIELRQRLDDLDTENKQLRLTIKALVRGLKAKGVIVKISGTHVSVKDNLGEHVERIEEG